ncbi:MAG: hypothetical protein JWM34_4014 [Ilumatobacteraceae bacterium]|nr:hypothetical protein [Ilumatobacteraceae bacterium]
MNGSSAFEGGVELPGSFGATPRTRECCAVFEDPFNPMESICEVLDDFDVIASPGGSILIARRLATSGMRTNLLAAMSAHQMGLRSIDEVRRRYLEEEPEDDAVKPDHLLDQYRSVVATCAEHIRLARRRLESTNESPPSDGVLAASVALTRLESGFRSINILYRIGCNHEGDSIARQMLEQIAWSYVAAQTTSRDRLGDLRPTKCISNLASAIPSVGPAYGQLNETTHLQYKHHHLAKNDNGQMRVRTQWRDFQWAASIVATLTDLWVVVWEWINRENMTSLISIDNAERLTPKADASFVVDMRTRINQMA